MLTIKAYAKLACKVLSFSVIVLILIQYTIQYVYHVNEKLRRPICEREAEKRKEKECEISYNVVPQKILQNLALLLHILTNCH